MTRKSKKKDDLPVPKAYRRAFERLEAAVDVNVRGNNTQKIRELGIQMFGDLWFPPDPNDPSERIFDEADKSERRAGI